MQGALPLILRVQDGFGKQIKKLLVEMGVADKPLGVDMIELCMKEAARSRRY